MRILVTGAFGLIGSELMKQLHAAGHEPIGIDDLSHPVMEPQYLWMLGIQSKVHIGPCADAGAITPPAELIIHCASPVGHAMLRPEANTAWKIIRDTQAMLELAEATGVRLITFSSSEVLTYKGETDIRAQYALGKLTSEAMVLGHPIVDGRVIRPYNVTGRYQRADGGFVMARFREQVRHRVPIEVFGSGEQVRHFTHVSDFAAFVLKLIEKWPAAPKRFCVFNPQNKSSIADLAIMFGRYASNTIRYEIDGRQALGNPNWRDSSERPLNMAEYEACQALGWAPKVTLKQIVREHVTGSMAMAQEA